MAVRSPELSESDLIVGNCKKKKKKISLRMIKQLLNSVIAKYRDLSATDKSRYFAQPRLIIVNFLTSCIPLTSTENSLHMKKLPGYVPTDKISASP